MSDTTTPRFYTPLIAIVLPVAVAAILFRLEPFEPALLPVQLGQSVVVVPARNDRARVGSEAVGEGQVEGPEDLAYDAASRVVYTGCEDGWIKRITVNDSAVESVVENWINTGGRPLGLTLLHNGELIVADAGKGLLRVSSEKEVELLVDEYEGPKFKLTDGVDVAEDGTIYFTDASHKYHMNGSVFDILEGKPNGRFFSYNPATKKTTLLAQDLYFANGVAVSPGMPDNIHYDGEGHYLIAMFTALTPELDLAFRYPFIRKVVAIVTKYAWNLPITKNGGFAIVDLDGTLTAHYYDPKLGLTSAIKIGNHIYAGSIFYPFVTRFDIEKYPALPTV